MTHLVHLSSSALRFVAEPEETLLQAGLRQGLALPFGCQSGRCGSCRARILSGLVDSPPAGEAGLSRQERAAGYVLMCQSRARSPIELRLDQPPGVERRRPRTLTARVAAKRPLANDVIELTLKLPAGAPFEFLPGQYVDFLLDGGQRRSFSIACPDATGNVLQFHLRVTPGGRFAQFVRDEMPERTLLRFEGPLGAFYLREDAGRRPALLVAGGTGFAPIKAMLERAFSRDPGRRLHLFWGARTNDDLYLHGLALSWAATHPGFSYTPVLSEPDPAWDGVRGLVHEAVLQRYPDLQQHAAYLAGPPAMVHAGRRGFLGAGLDPDHLFYDPFDYAFETWPSLG